MTRTATRRLKPAVATTLAAGAILGSVATPALAATGTGTPDQAAKQAACLAAVQQHAKDLIAARQRSLDALTTEVDGAAHLTTTDRAAISTVISSTRSGLTSLAATVAAATTCQQAHAADARIFTDLRVYVIVEPQAHLLLAVDHGLDGLTHLQTAADTIATAITAANTDGKDTVPAQAALKDLQARISDAAGQLATAHTEAAALTPSAFNADHDVTAPARLAARTGRQDILAAVADVRAAVADLKK